MSRPLRDRLGEMIRLARLGSTRFPWSSCDQEDWRRSADQLLRLAGASATVISERPSEVVASIAHVSFGEE